ncbi:MAG: hypothetical protein ACRDI2_08260 [Chloroflexota bacterium]
MSPVRTTKAGTPAPAPAPAEVLRGLLAMLTTIDQSAFRLSAESNPEVHAAVARDLAAADMAIYQLRDDASELLYHGEIAGVTRAPVADPADQEFFLCSHPSAQQVVAIRTGAVRQLVERLQVEVTWRPGQPGGAAGKRRRGRLISVAALPEALAQQTFPEAKALAIALADGPKLRRWKPVAGDIALWHHVDRATLQTKLNGGPLLDWLGLPSTVESLQEELRRAGLPAVLLLHVAIAGSLELAERNRLYVTVAVDDLLAAIGWKPRSTLERERMRRQVWRWLAMFDAAQIIGRRPGKYRDPDTKQEVDLQSIDALIRITGQRKPAQLAFDASVPPLEVTYAAGPWIEQWRGNHAILTYFGDVRRLATIPAGKPSGTWAQAIGLALHQRWRERSAYADVHHVGGDKALTVCFGTFTRRDLFDLFSPDPSADDVLGGHDPKRARAYWKDAIALLKQQGVVGYYKELGALPDKRQGWRDAWLDQELDIRPTEEGKQATAEIAKRSRTVRQSQAKRKARARQLALTEAGAA